MNEMKVVGVTDQRECYIASRTKSFRIHEFLIVEDPSQGDLVSQVVSTKSYNRFMPLSAEGEFLDNEMMENLAKIGFQLDEESVYIAKLRLLKDADYPIETGSGIRMPEFSEVREFFLTTTLDKALILGVIRNTDGMYSSMDEDLKHLVKTFEKHRIFEQKEVPYLLDLYGMQEYPHIGIFGGSGSGKSFGMRVLLEELMQKRIPTIVLDPHYEMLFEKKAFENYGKNYVEKYRVFEIGKNVGVKFEDLNTRELKNLLNTSSKLSEAMDGCVDFLHRPREGVTSFQMRLARLKQGQDIGKENLLKRIASTPDPNEKEDYQRTLAILQKYGDKCPPSSVSGIIWRFEKLVRLGIFECNSENLEQALKARRLCVVQGATKIIQVYSTFLMSRMYEKRRAYRDALIDGKDHMEEYFPPFFIVTDECHNFSPQDGNVSSKYIIREIAQEGRKYGVFLILATQRPSLVDSTVTAQLNTKLIFRTTRSSDIQTISEETDLNKEELRQLPYLNTGDVFVSQAQVGRSMFVRVRAAHTDTPHKTHPFEELETISSQHNDSFYEIVREYFPIKDMELMELSKRIEEKTGIVYTNYQLEQKLDLLYQQKKCEKRNTIFGREYYEI